MNAIKTIEVDGIEYSIGGGSGGTGGVLPVDDMKFEEYAAYDPLAGIFGEGIRVVSVPEAIKDIMGMETDELLQAANEALTVTVNYSSPEVSAQYVLHKMMGQSVTNERMSMTSINYGLGFSIGHNEEDEESFIAGMYFTIYKVESDEENVFLLALGETPLMI